MQDIFTPNWSTVFRSLNILIDFKIRLDNAPENTFENNPALKGWWIRWSNQHFPVIFSPDPFIFCYLIVPVQHPALLRDYPLGSAAQRWDIVPPTGSHSYLGNAWHPPLRPSHHCTCTARLVFNSRLCRSAPQPKASPAHTQVVLSGTGSFPTPYPPGMMCTGDNISFPSLRAFSAVTDEW